MARWTTEEDAALQEHTADGLTAGQVAELLKRSEGGVRARAAALEISFDSRGGQAIREHLRAGRAILREDIGAPVGIRWADAARQVGSFDTAMCERMLAKGLITARDRERPHIFHAVLQPLGAAS